MTFRRDQEPGSRISPPSPPFDSSASSAATNIITRACFGRRFHRDGHIHHHGRVDSGGGARKPKWQRSDARNGKQKPMIRDQRGFSCRSASASSQLELTSVAAYLLLEERDEVVFANSINSLQSILLHFRNPKRCQALSSLLKGQHHSRHQNTNLCRHLRRHLHRQSSRHRLHRHDRNGKHNRILSRSLASHRRRILSSRR